MQNKNPSESKFIKIFGHFLVLTPWFFLAGLLQVNFQKFLPFQRIFKGINFFDYFTVTDIYITLLAALFIIWLIKGVFGIPSARPGQHDKNLFAEQNSGLEQTGRKTCIWGKYFPNELVICAILVCAAGILQIIFQKVYEPVLSTPIEYFRGYFLYPLIFVFILLRTADKEIINRLVRSYILMVTVFCVLALTQYLFGLFPGDQYDFTKRLVWPYVDFLTLKAANANWVAFFVMPAFLLSFMHLANMIKTGTLLTGVKLSKGAALYNTMIMLGALTLFLTQSYGSWVAVFLVMIFYLFRLLSRKQFVVCALLLVFAAGGIFLAIQNSYKYKIMTGAQEYKYANSIVSRGDIYRMDLAMITTHPILGVGLNQFQSYFAQNHEQILEHKYMESQIPPHAHNFFLGMWISLGLLGFFGMLLLVLGVLRNSKFDVNNPAAYVLLAIMIHGLIDSYYWRQEIAYTFWIVVAISLLYRLPRNQLSLKD